MSLFQRHAFWMTLVATILTVALLADYSHNQVDIRLRSTYFQVGGHIMSQPFLIMARVFILVFLAQTLLLFLLRDQIRTMFVLPAHLIVSLILLILLLCFSPVSHLVLAFNLLAFLSLTQVWFIFVFILALRQMIRGKKGEGDLDK